MLTGRGKINHLINILTIIVAMSLTPPQMYLIPTIPVLLNVLPPQLVIFSGFVMTTSSPVLVMAVQLFGFQDHADPM